MKKFLFTLTLICSLFTVTAFASDVKVTHQVLTAFKSNFNDATNVQWAQVKSLYQAQFTMDEEQYSAYFDADGKMLVVARFITTEQLPRGLKSSLKELAGNDVISFVFELTDDEGSHFYATLQKGDKKEMLQSNGLKKWVPYNKVKI